MPSSPKIPKDLILKNALTMLIRDGFSSINIKTLAKEIGCSTQPISWHFGNMDGLRKELSLYALNYANDKMRSAASDGMDAFMNIGVVYVSLAFDEPNLFKYLYMSGESGYRAGDFSVLINADENSAMVEQIATQLNVPRENISKFFQNIVIYTHGLASLVASGVIVSTKEQVIAMVKNTAYDFLLQTGVDFEKM